MPRSIALGNGNMLVNLDKKGLIHDFYFPFVGMEDHTTFKHFHRIGIFEEETNKFSWLNDDEWEGENKYVDDSLVSRTVLRSKEWALSIIFEDFVHPSENIFCRRIHVVNDRKNNRKFKLFFGFDFHLYGVKGNDTAYYDLKSRTIIFYKFNRYFLINGKGQSGGIEQYTTGKSEYRGFVGTWKDAEDGKLEGNPIEQGSIDATISLKTEVNGFEDSVVELWICAGEDKEEIQRLDNFVQENRPSQLMDHTKAYWKSWVNKQQIDFKILPKNLVELFKKSLLVVRTQIDNRGAIIAANDTDIMKFNKDTYSYMWPRDGAFVAMAMDRAGYSDITREFFKFCMKVQSKEGYFLQKYNPDGSVGSSWHPWIEEGKYQVPLQEDETALLLVAMERHYNEAHDIEFLKEIYEKLVVKAADFIVSYIDDKTGLPFPSYDLWEEQKGVFSYTCATVYAGLMSAVRLSEVIGHNRHLAKYRGVAEKLRKAIVKNLYCSEQNTFVKKITIGEDGQFVKDYTPDSSIMMLFILGVLEPTDPMIVNTVNRIYQELWVKTEIGGLARYREDYYHSVSDHSDGVVGNPWIITTLWYAQWLIMSAKDNKDEKLTKALDLLNWVEKRANQAGILPEQINPYNGEPLSVAPLTWSHSTYVETILMFLAKFS